MQNESRSILKIVGVYPDDPKLKDLVCELKEVDWNQLGIQLNVPRHILSSGVARAMELVGHHCACAKALTTPSN